jgi:hypothetical protein
MAILDDLLHSFNVHIKYIAIYSTPEDGYIVAETCSDSKYKKFCTYIVARRRYNSICCQDLKCCFKYRPKHQGCNRSYCLSPLSRFIVILHVQMTIPHLKHNAL